ncbi:MAG: methyltransferase domain-containing protein [Syntrophorhabdales bacterium]|jgi:2-polyprenyl-3-methyl-5-hydroxy-6-metoxy-1,4-benzoquinol methylase
MTDNDDVRKRWEQEFTRGDWEYLKSEHQIPRYAVLCSYMKHLGRPISLLDVGCGEGLILNFCGREWLPNYWGLDISQTALDRITSLSSADRLICSSLEDFSTDRKFDVILFNEVLYYTADPFSHLERFRDYLKPGGVFLISTCKQSGWFSSHDCSITSVLRFWRSPINRSMRSVWRLVDRCKWKRLDEVVIRNISRKTSYRIALIQP